MSPKRSSMLLAGIWWVVVFVFSFVVYTFLAGSILGMLVWFMMCVPVVWTTGRRAAAEWRNARRSKALQKDRLSADRRPPILYLRSFAEDGMVPEKSLWVAFIELAVPTNFIAGALRPDKTHEEIIARAFRKIGPVVALAQPGDEFPELGAIRLKAPETEWQQKIESLLRDCNMVIFNFGQLSASEALWWELTRATELVPLSRIAIFLELGETDWGVKQVRYKKLKERLEPILCEQLPVRIRWNNFLYFDDAGPRLARTMRSVVSAKRSDLVSLDDLWY